jgi:hypothetical protein
LQRSDNVDPLLEAIDSALRELEALCAMLERALVRRSWRDVERAIADSRRITHALQNAMEEAAHLRSAAFDEGVLRRLRHVYALRQNQMARLQQYRDAVGDRLKLTARWKAALRSMSTGRAARVQAVDGLT